MPFARDMKMRSTNAVLSAALIVQCSAFGVANADVVGSSETVEEIIVTASKRSESLKEVPASLSVLTSAAMEEQGIEQFSDYMTLVPGLSQLSGGQPGRGQVTMRGLSTGSVQTTPTVGFYIDEIPFTPSGSLGQGALVTPDPDLGSVERVEVLRGPQGTIYGASSLGGLIRIISPKPDTEAFAGDVRVQGSAVRGGGNGYGLHASVNVPLLSDRAAVRVTGFHREDPGFTDNVSTGARNTNQSLVEGGRVDLRLIPRDDITLDLSFLAQDIHAKGSATIDADPSTLRPLFGESGFSAAFAPEFRAQYRAANGTLAWEFERGTLTSATSYAEAENTVFEDYTSAWAPFGLLSPGAVAPTSYGPTMEKLSQEIRYASERSGRIEWLAGLFYTSEDNSYPFRSISSIPPSTDPIPGLAGVILESTVASEYEEYAAFGNFTYFLTDSVDVTLGLRHAVNDQSATTTARGLLFGGLTPVTQPSPDSSDESTTFLFTLRTRVSDDINAYVRAASGYRPGGPQINPRPGLPTAFDPDTANNYEAGIKGDFFDGAMTANVAVYYIDWQDMQANVVIDGLSVKGNAGDARSQGVELEAQLRPVSGLQLGLSAAYNDSEVRKLAPNAATLGASVGDQLPYAPEWSGALTADYRLALTAAIEASLGASYRHRGESYAAFSGSAANAEIVVPAFDTLDLRAGVAIGQVSLIARVENVLNELGFISMTPGDSSLAMPARVTVVQPRTFALSASWKF